MARILLCDDDRSYAETVVEFLEAKGYKTYHALDVEEFVHMIDGGYELAIVDMQIRGGGPQAVREAKKRQVPVILVSSMPLEKQREWFADPTGIRFLAKPVRLPDLLNAVREALGA